MIYVCTPYTHEDSKIMQARFEQAVHISGFLMQAGHIVYVPIVATHPVACACELPREYEYWHEHDEEFISQADEVWVCMIDGWEESTGIAREVKMADELEIPVRFFTVEFDKVTGRVYSMAHKPQTERLKCLLKKI